MKSIDWERVTDISVLAMLGGALVVFSLPLWALFFYVAVIPLGVRRLWLGPRPDWRDPAVALPLALILWSLLTLAWSDPPAPHSVGRALWVWNGVCTGMFFLVSLGFAERSAARRDRMIDVLLWCGLVNALVALGSYFLGGHMGTRLGGWAMTRNPSLGATILGICAVLAFNRALQPERRWFVWLAMLVPFGAFMVLSESRGAMLFLAIAILPMLLMQESGPARRRAWMLGTIAVVLVGGGAAITLWHPGRMVALVSQMMERPPLRFLIWRDSVPQILSRIWFGHGPTAELHHVSNVPVVFGHHPHNLYLATTFYSGLVGLALLLTWLGWLFHRLRHLAPQPARAMGFTLLLYPMLCGLTDLAQLIKGPAAIWYIVWLPILLVTSVIRQRPAEAASPGP